MSESRERPFVIKTEIKQEPENNYEYDNFNQNFMNAVKYLKKENKDCEHNNNEIVVKQETKEIKTVSQPQGEPTKVDLSTKYKKKINNTKHYYPRHSNSYYPFQHTCHLCYRKFRTYWSLQSHWQTSYYMCNSIFKCWKCHNIYNTHKALKRHTSKCNLNVTSDQKDPNEIKPNIIDVKIKLETNKVVVKTEQDNQIDDVLENVENSNISSMADLNTLKQQNVKNVNPITLANMKTALKSIAESQINSIDGAKAQINPFNLLLVMDQYLGDMKEGGNIPKPMPLPIETVKIENEDYF